jgi:hypothetical protein
MASRSPKPMVLAEIICLRQYIGGTIVYLRFCGFFKSSPGITYSKIQLDAPIYWRSYSREEHFVPPLRICQDITSSPINLAVASETGNSCFTQN